MMMLCIIGFLGSAAGLGQTLWRSEKEQKDFDRLAQIALAGNQEQTKNTGKTGDSEVSGPGSSDGRQELNINCEELARLNGDFAGWLYIDGTKINYPVMHTPEDQQYYIHRDFYGNRSYGGTLFMGDQCDVDSQSMIIYGHNMKNGSMFGELENYGEISWWEDHPVIEFYTEEGNRRYEVFAAFRTRIFSDGEDGFRYYQYIGDLSGDQFDTFVRQLRREALYDTGIVPEYKDQILMLSTCSYHTADGRFVVAARKAAEENE